MSLPLRKSPTENLIYELDWSKWLAENVSPSDTITGSVWIVPTGITLVSDDSSSTTTTAEFSGGTDGVTYEPINRITLTSGQVAEQSLTIRVSSLSDAVYCSIGEVRAMAQGMTAQGSPPATDDLIPDIIERVSRLFDLELGVPPGYFNPASPSAVATSKTFYGDGSNYLRIDPYLPGTLNTTLVMPDGYTVPTFIESDGYLVITVGGNIPFPGRYWGWHRPSYGWYQGVPITVSAIWGFSSTPADVKLAVIEWVINVWRETDPATLKLVGLEGQALREDIPPRVKRIVSNWSMKSGAVFV